MSADDPRNFTHVTEFGLGVCAGLGKETFREHGLRPDTRACGDIGQPHDGSGGSARYIGVDQCGDTILTLLTPRNVPTCPRCAVLRDAALEGRLPELTAPAASAASPR